MNPNTSKQLLFVLSLIAIILMWSLLYAVPRYKSTGELEARSIKLRSERANITQAIEDFVDSNYDKPAPTPNAMSWLTSHTLQGLDKQIEMNNPYKNSQGVQVKLRGITAEQITEILDSMRPVNLIIKKFQLEDNNGDGKWNLEFMVEVP
ncbi:hypothetical protein IJT10_07200 [bacterium]|nr:hypothetical protein [bacterium]